VGIGQGDGVRTDDPAQSVDLNPEGGVLLSKTLDLSDRVGKVAWIAELSELVALHR
jgi:hypothetical protein